MPARFELTELGLPEGSVYHQLHERFPEAELERFEPGERLLEEGELSSDVFLLLRGRCDVARPGAPAGGESSEPLATVSVDDPAAPAFIGEMAYLGGGPRSATVHAADDTFALRLHAGHLHAVIDEFPVFTRVLCRQFSERLRNTGESLAEYERMFSVPKTRLAKDAGEPLFEKGESADTLYQVLEGSVARETGAGWQVIDPDTLFLGVLDPVPWLCDGAWSFSARTETEPTLAAIPKSAKYALIRTMPELVVNCLKGM